MTTNRSRARRLGALLKGWRRARTDLSAIQVGRKAGLSESMCSKIELGQRLPSRSALDRICDVMEMDGKDRLKARRLVAEAHLTPGLLRDLLKAYRLVGKGEKR